MLLIIDNQSRYIHKFKHNYLDELDIPYHFIDHNDAIDFNLLPQVQGMILSGGKGSPYEPLNLTSNFVALMNLDVPTLGFCLGHEVIAVTGGGRIKRLPEYQNRKSAITLDTLDDPIFAGLDSTEVRIQKRHRYHVINLPQNYLRLAHSDICPNEIIRHKEKAVYGFQGHPEVSGSSCLTMMDNFMRMCGLID
jgi:GMP synthase (glutamine-hydrolysing)